jgi:hypothetical protein
MDFESPSEPVQKTPSRKIMKGWPTSGSSPGVSLPSAHISKSENLKRFTKPSYGPRAGFDYPLRERVSDPPTDHITGQSAHGIESLQGFDLVLLAEAIPSRAPLALSPFVPVFFFRVAWGSGRSPAHEKCRSRPQSFQPEKPAR